MGSFQNTSNSNMNGTSLYESYNLDVLDIIQIIFYTGLSSASVILNSIVITIFILYLKKTTFSNLLYFSNSVSDFLVASFVIPARLADIIITQSDLYRDQNFFKIVDFVDDVLSCFSIANLVFMSLHRLFQLKFALKTNEHITSKNLVIIIMVWILIFSFWLSGLIINLTLDFKTCMPNFQFFYSLVGQILFYFIPLVLITVLNVLTLIELKKRNKAKQSIGLEHLENANSNGKTHTFKHYKPYFCLFGISLTIILSFILYVFIYPIDIYCSEMLNHHLIDATISLTFLIVVMNPLILLIFQDSFKTELIKSYNRFKAFLMRKHP